MTTVAVLADPPRPGMTLSRLVDGGVLDADEAVALYTATLRDACHAVESSGGDLLVNYRVSDDAAEETVERAVREAVAPALDSPDAARFEVQVGSSRSARVGNTVTHLLEREEVQTAAVLDPRVALVERRHVDSAAMKLRQSPVVLGPVYGGRVWYAAFREPIDFTDAFAPPALGTLTERARAHDLDVDFLETLPLVERQADLASAAVDLRARGRAGKPVPPHTGAVFEELDLDVTTDETGVATIERE